MLNIVKNVKKRQDAIAQQVLSGVDTLGAKLNTIGVKNSINRHTLISQAWVQKHRLEGEMARFDLLLHSSLRPLKKARNKIDQTLDEAIDFLPAPIARRAHRTHEHIKRLSGG